MAINHLLRQTVIVRNPTGARDLHAKPTFGSEVSMRARFERTYKTIAVSQTERQPIHGIVFVGPNENVQIGAKLTYNGEVFRVLQRADQVGRNGQVHHYELMVQLWSYV